MSTSANFPVSLYVTDSTILGATLTQSEWQQVAVEVEAVEAALGIDPAGTSDTVVARFATYSTAAASSFTQLSGTLSATQHGAQTSTSATHPFSALTNTLGTTQTSTAAASVYAFGGVGANSLQAVANPSLSHLPVANSGITTLSSLDVQGNATSTTSTRTYVGHFGVTTTAQDTGSGDVVALYAGALSNATAGPHLWSFNTVMTMGTGASTSRSYQGYELDFNNYSTDAGDETGAAGLARAVYPLSINGAGTYRSVAALSILANNGSALWNRGILFYSSVTQASIQDFGAPDRVLDVRGRPNTIMHYNGANTAAFLIRSTVISEGLNFFGNLGMGANAHSNASNSVVLGNSNTPTTAVTDAIQIFSENTSSGATTLALFIEQEPEVTATFAQSHRIKVKINGVEYWLSLDDV